MQIVIDEMGYVRHDAKNKDSTTVAYPQQVTRL